MPCGDDVPADESNAALFRDERGATTTEYGLMVGFVALALTIALGIFGAAVGEFYEGLMPQILALFGG